MCKRKHNNKDAICRDTGLTISVPYRERIVSFTENWYFLEKFTYKSHRIQKVQSSISQKYLVKCILFLRRWFFFQGQLKKFWRMKKILMGGQKIIFFCGAKIFFEGVREEKKICGWVPIFLLLFVVSFLRSNFFLKGSKKLFCEGVLSF